jgi:hypothetical protein
MICFSTFSKILVVLFPLSYDKQERFPYQLKGGLHVENEYTHITIILDRTGSMQSIRDDTIGGFNVFLAENKNQPGKCTLTLVQFDSQDPYEIIHQFKPLDEVPDLTHETYVPRASTPLLDALGRGINDLEQQLSLLDAGKKPAGVVFVVVTDGKENASREFSRDQIIKMIADKQEKDEWQFVYLSADLDAINEAAQHGFRDRSVMGFDKTSIGSKAAWDSLSKRHRTYRREIQRGFGFIDEDRRKHEIEKKRKKGSDS